MKWNLTLEEKDYLTFQLFFSSLSKNINNTKKRDRIYFPLTLCIISSILFLQKQIGNAQGFFILAFLWFIFYPIYQKWYFKRHYSKHVKENHKNNFGRITDLEISEEYIKTESEGIESKVDANLISKIYEIENYFYIVIRTNNTYIIPKSQIKKANETRAFLKNLAEKKDVEYIHKDKWSW
jgi:hypothetical protein